ncbi:MAG: protein kinase, partial [Candidatus Dadabacteria bacterium]|nr:protein kinase [Candidatus Dadabacteria bacterium]NIT13499.1 protein kinase [Candidatus Dadabacteria bacterium]
MCDLINKVIGHYKITEEIALGGMGKVYKALNQKLNRDVAIKVINPNLISNPNLINRFYKEAKIQAQMSHINIVTVYDFFEHNNNHFLVMEYLGGESVDKIIKEQGPFDIVTAISMMKQILAGLSHAHSKGVIHKDIKTSNFILTPTVIKITDFGISQLITEITDEKKIMGTLHYMSPEQILGNKVDYRTDIYSVSVTFYEILTGRFPYGTDFSTENEIKKAHLKLDPIPITSINEKIPEELNKIILKGLSKNRNVRFQSANDYLIAIDKFINDNKSTKIRTLEISEGKYTTGINFDNVNFTFQGDIQVKPFHKLLVNLFDKRITGFLFIDSDIKLQIYFQKGYIANVSGIIEDLTLGEMLVRNSVITEEDQKQAVNFSLETGLKIGEVLITMNKITSHDLSSILEVQIKDKLHRGFLLRKGKYGFKELDDLRLSIAYNIHPLQVVYNHINSTKHEDLDEDLLNKKLNSNYIVCSDIEEKLKGVVFSQSKEVRIIDKLKNMNGQINPVKDINLDKETKFNFLHFLTISELIETAENVQNDKDDSIKEQPEVKKEKSKKVKFEVKRTLSSGRTVSYLEERDVPTNDNDEHEPIEND